jgi:hypothetical protein
MAAPVPRAQRDEKKAQAFALSLRGQHGPAIARALGVSLKTAKGYVREVRGELAADQNESHDLDNYLAAQDTVIGEGWKRLSSREMKESSANVSAILSTISTAHERKAKALGLLKDKLEHSGKDGRPVEILAEFERLLDKPVTIHMIPPPGVETSQR